MLDPGRLKWLATKAQVRIDAARMDLTNLANECWNDDPDGPWAWLFMDARDTGAQLDDLSDTLDVWLRRLEQEPET